VLRATLLEKSRSSEQPNSPLGLFAHDLVLCVMLASVSRNRFDEVVELVRRVLSGLRCGCVSVLLVTDGASKLDFRLQKLSPRKQTTQTKTVCDSFAIC